MRRILWTLAATTAITTNGPLATAQEGAVFSSSAAGRESGPGRSNVTFSSGRPPAGIGRAAPSTANYSELLGSEQQSTSGARPFPGGRETLPPVGSLKDQRASDLFRRELSGNRAPVEESPSQDQSDDGFRQVSGEQTAAARRVVHAEYERQPGQIDRVEQVNTGARAPEFPESAVRGFPGDAQTEPAPQPAPQAERRFTRETFGTASSNSRLGEPISTTPGAGVYDFGPSAAPAVQSTRGVTFQRSAPEARTSFSPSVHEPQASLPASSRFARTAAIDTKAAPEAAGGDPLGALSKKMHSGPQAPTVSVEWVTRSGINVGQECDCDLVVKNTGIIPATNVEVTARFPASVRLVTVEPQPADADSALLWKFADLQPSQEQVIHIRLVPSERGTINTQADVRFSGTAAASLTVAEPLLDVTCEGPDRVLIGEPASRTVVITNPGSGIATNVQIEAIIPEGLEHARGSRLVMDVGSLNPGETRSVRLALAAIKGGRQVVQVQGRADGDLVRNTQSEVMIVAPSIVAEMDGPGLRYLGRNATYTLRVRNDGEINVENVRVMHKLPEGFEVVETDHGAQFDRANRLVNWFVGRLAAGGTSEMKVTVRADQIGSFTHFIRATSEHGAISDAQFTTQVEGTPSLEMKVRDLDDPVEVGNETAYEIVIKNDGSAPARGVCLACEIPAGLEVLKAQGPVESIKQRDLVSFNPVLELAPGNSITYRVHVRGTTAGQHRLRAKLSSEATPDALTADEVTKFYGE